MTDQSFEFDVLRDLLDEAGAIGALAANEKTFLAAYKAFRAQNRDAFHASLTEPGLVGRCRLVCEWIRIKECVFLCLELCGPPTAADKPPDPRVVAEAIVRVTSNPKLVEQLVQILAKRDKDAFQKFVRAQKLQGFTHFFCHWVCVVRYRLLCEWICGPIVLSPAGKPVPAPGVPAIAAELMAAGHALRELLEHRQAFSAAVKASTAGDADGLQKAIGSAGLLFPCRFVCEWFCAWRCIWACLTFCRIFPLPVITNEVNEALAFARVTATLGRQPLQLERLSEAIGSGNAKAVGALVKELQLERFCIQICHWICFLRCRRFCFLVCPPPGLLPVFTAIGDFDYTTDVASALGGSGLTTDPAHPNYAFFSNLRLHGILTQTLGGAAMEYRFETIQTDATGAAIGAWTPVLPAQIAATQIGWWERFELLPTPHVATKKYWVNKSPLGPNDLAATIAADGWIQVPQENNVFSAAGAFSPQDMLMLISSSLAPFAPQDEAGTTAGSAAAHPLVKDLYFGIRMRVRQVGVPLSEADGGTCVHIAVDNTRYKNVNHHPDWDGGVKPDPEVAVSMVDIAELVAHPCSGISKTLTVQFTSAHPNLDGVSLRMDGPGGPYGFTLPAIPEAGDWFGTATNNFNISKLPNCAYLITLTTGVLLTDGDNFADPVYDQIAFCKVS